MGQHLGRNFEILQKRYLKPKCFFFVREQRVNCWRAGFCRWEVKIAFHSSQAAALIKEFLGPFLRRKFGITKQVDLSVYYRGVISCTDGYNYPLGKRRWF